MDPTFAAGVVARYTEGGSRLAAASDMFSALPDAPTVPPSRTFLARIRHSRPMS